MTQFELNISDFTIGDRIETHPATDAWMSGDRYGVVTKIGRKYVHVQMNRSDKVKQFEAKDIGLVTLTAHGPDGQETPYIPMRPPPDPCDNSLIEKLRPKPKPKPAMRFEVAGKTISTRSSNPALRKLAKKLQRKAEGK